MTVAAMIIPRRSCTRLVPVCLACMAALDYDLEVAYQFGDASHLGALFTNMGSNFGDTDAHYDNWAIDRQTRIYLSRSPLAA